MAATVALLVVLRLQGAGEGDTEDRGTTSAPPGTPTAPTEMLIQKRVRGGPKENFARTFAEYEEGFSSHGNAAISLFFAADSLCRRGLVGFSRAPQGDQQRQLGAPRQAHRLERQDLLGLLRQVPGQPDTAKLYAG